MRRAVAGVVLGVVASGLVATSAPPGVADGLGTTAFSDLVVDTAHARVFVSGGGIKVARLDGTVIATATGTTDARQMALSADGSTLLVADGDGISLVDPLTAAVTRHIDTGTDSCPDAIAPAAGLVFFSSGDCAGGTPGLGAVDLDTGTVTTGIATPGLTLNNVRFDNVASAPSMFAVLTLTGAAVLDAVATPAPAVTVRASVAADPGDLKDIALTPDAAKLLVQGISTTEIRSTTNLAVQDTYTATGPAVAVRADGYVAIGQVPTPTKRYDVIFQKGTSSTPSATAMVGTEEMTGRPGGLRFGTKRIYGVFRNPSGSYTLRTAAGGPQAKVGITLNQSTFTSGDKARVSVHLPQATTSRTVDLYTIVAGTKTPKRIKRLLVPRSTGRVSVAVPVTKNQTLEARFVGDDAWQPNRARKQLKVRSKLVIDSGTTRRSGRNYVLPSRGVSAVTVTVYPIRPGQCVSAIGLLQLEGGYIEKFAENPCLRTTSKGRVRIELSGFVPGDEITLQFEAAATSTNIRSATIPYGILFR